MKALGAALLLVVVPTLASASEPPRSACVACHLEAPGALAEPPKLFADDVHAARGLDCSSCHGGDPTAHDDEDLAHAAEKGFRGAPAPAEVPDFCGRCHSDVETMRRYDPRARVDQVTEYRESDHGKALAAGDARVATCVACHGAHGVQPVKSPRSPVHPTRVADTCGRCHSDATLMAAYGLPADIAAIWRKSVHGRAIGRGDIAAPSCNGCHGNHGAAPPGVGSIAHVCGHCHSREAELFAASPLAEPWRKAGLAECVKCHGNHGVEPPGDEMVGTGSDAVCAGCHEHGEAGRGVAAAVRGSYDELSRAIATADELLGRAERLGMEVSQEKYALSSARDDLVEARVLVHSFDAAMVRAKVEQGLGTARAAEKAGTTALDELRSRWRGLIVSTLLILAAAGALVLKIREMERPAV